jgi:butyrate kinase
MKEHRVFAINPGSTSTKIALFENDRLLYSANVSHEAEKLKEFQEISDQFDYRKETILNLLNENNVSLQDISAFVGRGGGQAPLAGGVYLINDLLLHHARFEYTIRHPAILGSQLAHDFASTYGGQAFVVNSPDVDEFDEVARVTGLVNIYRESKTHALNQKEVGIRYGASINKNYDELNLIIAHIGGGISIVAHRKGMMVDSNDIVNGDGPMAPTRSGSIPARDIVKMCFSGKYSEKDIYDKFTKSGGLIDHLGTSNVREIKKRIDQGDVKAKLIYDAMIYQICKSIGASASVLKGKVDAIILTGGIANDQYLVDRIKESVEFVAPVKVMAGEFEMEAMAAGAIRVLTGKETPKEYTGVPVWNGFRFGGQVVRKK